MAGINPTAQYKQTVYPTDAGTTYVTKIDANFIASQRVVDNFAAHQQATANMTVVVEPGHIFDGATLTEIGAQTTLALTNASTTATVGSAVGISNGMVIIAAAGVTNNATGTISGTTVTLSTAATTTATVAASFLQVTGAFSAPGGNPRIDRIVADRFTGSISVVTGTPAGTPVAPSITSGKVPICQILLQTSSTSITNSMITDERAVEAFGRGTGGESNTGTSAGSIVQLDGSGKLPAVDGSQLTGIVSVPTGAIFFFPANAVPSGYLECNGQLVLRATYATLWTYAQGSGNIAATDGAWTKGQFSPGDGSTNFRLPDTRGYFLRSWDDSAGVDSGRAIGSTQADAFASHTHTATDAGHTHTYSVQGTSNVVGQATYAAGALGTTQGTAINLTSGTGNASVTNSSTGGTETRPINLAFIVGIKT